MLLGGSWAFEIIVKKTSQTVRIEVFWGKLFKWGKKIRKLDDNKYQSVMSCLSILNGSSVVYIDQGLAAAHCKHWSKSDFSTFVMTKKAEKGKKK